MLRVLRDFNIFLPFKVIGFILLKYITVLIKNFLFFPCVFLLLAYCNSKLYLFHFHILYLIGTIVENVIMSLFPHILSSWMYINIKTRISKFYFPYLNSSRYLVCGSYLPCTHLSAITSSKANYSLIITWEFGREISRNHYCKSELMWISWLSVSEVILHVAKVREHSFWVSEVIKLNSKIINFVRLRLWVLKK